MSTWEPGDYATIITIGASAIGSVLLIIFKSRCSKISICWGLWSCDREVSKEEKIKKEASAVVEP